MYWIIFYLDFLSGTLTINRKTGEGIWTFFLSNTSTRSQIFRYLFAVLQLKCLRCISKVNACNYGTVTWMVFIHLWELIFDWFDWLCLVDVINLSLASDEFELAQVLKKKHTKCLMVFILITNCSSSCPKSQDQKQMIQLQTEKKTTYGEIMEDFYMLEKQIIVSDQSLLFFYIHL